MADDRNQIRVVMDGLEEYSERLIIGIALEVHATLVEDTPVDTGWAQNNWVPNVGGPGASSSQNEGNAASAKAKMTAGLASVAGYKLRSGPIHITNNVPYIEPLNAGHSKQAPKDFVPMAINKGADRAMKRLG